jgi:hypothetical protein
VELKVRIDAPRDGVRRLVLFVCLPIALVLSFALAAHAIDTSWILSGQVLSANKLKAALDETQTRLAALEAAQGKQIQVSAEIRDTGTVVRQFSTAGWTLNPTKSGTGVYVLSFGAGVALSAPPICTTAPLWGRNDFIRVSADSEGTESTTSVTIKTASWETGAAEDSGFTIICFGLKT